MLASFFTSNIPLHIEQNPVKKMELKMYIPVGLKLVFQKIKFKVLHYIEHDFIRQRPGPSKDQIMFKSLFIDYSILKYCLKFYWLYKGDEYLFFCKSRCGKCSPRNKLFIKTSRDTIQKDHVHHAK